MRVPQVFADFCSSYGNIPNVLLLFAFTAFQYAETRRILGRSRLTLKDMFLTQDCLLGVIVIFVILDVAVFTLLLLKTLLHLLCIFGILALAAYVIPYFRPGTRPKHSAPCMALLSALYVVFEFRHPNNSYFKKKRISLILFYQVSAIQRRRFGRLDGAFLYFDRRDMVHPCLRLLLCSRHLPHRQASFRPAHSWAQWRALHAERRRSVCQRR